ncbi:MAG: histidine phosphatase family protein [Candidatus Symbiobacter sp.]|nr:histidine phosphatase family protein [Candidatus Symbiobacter sp.]
MNLPLYLVRHGAVKDGVCDGEARLPVPDSELDSPAAPEQTQPLAMAVAQLPTGASDYYWVSSPMRRARQSAALLAAHYHQAQIAAGCATDFAAGSPIAPAILAGGEEQDFGAWCGHSWSEIERNFPTPSALFWQDAWRHAPPDGESFQACSRRIRGWFRQIACNCLAAQAKGAVVISHAGPIRIIMAGLRSWPPDQALALDAKLAHWSVTRLDFSPPKIICDPLWPQAT